MAEEIVIFSRTGAKASTVAVDKAQSAGVKSMRKEDAALRRLSLRQQKAMAAYLSGNL